MPITIQIKISFLAHPGIRLLLRNPTLNPDCFICHLGMHIRQSFMKISLGIIELLKNQRGGGGIDEPQICMQC